MFTELRVNSDAGNPEANFTGNPRLAQSLDELARNLAAQVRLHNAQKATPELNVS
jgi:hypothetical protein